MNVAERTEAALRGVDSERPAVIAATEDVLDGQGETVSALVKGDSLPNTPRPAFVCRPVE